MVDGRHTKKSKKCNISARFTDFNEIWYVMQRPSGPYQLIKFQDFKITNWRAAAILKEKNCKNDLSVVANGRRHNL